MSGLSLSRCARLTHCRAKEFEGLSSSSQQISKLKKILAELGMTGRLSMEKAKEIRERREFAQEMGAALNSCFRKVAADQFAVEDVLEFDSKVNGTSGRGGRASRSAATSTSKKTVVESDDDGDEAGNSPGPSKPSGSKKVWRRSAQRSRCC